MTNIITNLTQQKAITLLRILYPVWMIVGIFSLQYVPSTLIVLGDAATTASNIVANELLFRMGIVGSLMIQLLHIAVVLILYQLFKSVDKNQASLIVILGLVGVPIAMLNTLGKVMALTLVNSADQMMFYLNMNTNGIMIASIFWGLWLLPQGYLIIKSGYFPKIFGFLMYLAGLSYFIGSFVYFLLPTLAIIPALNILAIGEVLFMGWVVLKGAKLPSKDANKETG